MNTPIFQVTPDNKSCSYYSLAVNGTGTLVKQKYFLAFFNHYNYEKKKPESYFYFSSDALEPDVLRFETDNLNKILGTEIYWRFTKTQPTIKAMLENKQQWVENTKIEKAKENKNWTYKYDLSQFYVQKFTLTAEE